MRYRLLDHDTPKIRQLQSIQDYYDTLSLPCTAEINHDFSDSIIGDECHEQILSIHSDAIISDINVPKDFESATTSRYAPRWGDAMKTAI